jgi:hypothetical protein
MDFKRNLPTWLIGLAAVVHAESSLLMERLDGVLLLDSPQDDGFGAIIAVQLAHGVNPACLRSRRFIKHFVLRADNGLDLWAFTAATPTNIFTIFKTLARVDPGSQTIDHIMGETGAMFGGALGVTQLSPIAKRRRTAPRR